MKMNYDVVVNFGCSFMNGDRPRYINENGEEVALGEEIVAAKLLSKELNCDYVHLAKTGGANDTIFRRLYGWVESNTEYKHPLLIIGLTEPARFSYFCEREDRFYNLHPHHIDDYDDRGLGRLNKRVTNNIEDPKLLRHWLKYYMKWIWNDDAGSKTLQREVMFLHHYLKGNNCDYRILNALHDCLTAKVQRLGNLKYCAIGDIKDKINYITFQDDEYKGTDTWYQYLRWQMKHIDNEEFECMDENGKQKYRNPFPPFGKRFCEGHPSPNANKELFERIHDDLDL